MVILTGCKLTALRFFVALSLVVFDLWHCLPVIPAFSWLFCRAFGPVAVFFTGIAVVGIDKLAGVGAVSERGPCRAYGASARP